MIKVSFDKATPADLREIERLARIIWHEYYTPIIGEKQVDYMLEKFQSAEAMREQLGEGALYYLVQADGEAAGYFCVKQDGTNLFLSKIYLLAAMRGKGIGAQTIDFIAALALGFSCTGITLTVNKKNAASIAAYKKLGFAVTGPLLSDIGGGYVMDDYAMRRPL